MHFGKLDSEVVCIEVVLVLAFVSTTALALTPPSRRSDLLAINTPGRGADVAGKAARTPCSHLPQLSKESLLLTSKTTHTKAAFS